MTAAVERKYTCTDNLGRPHYRLVAKSPTGPDPHAASRDESLRRHEQVKAAVRMHGLVDQAVHPTEAARAITDAGRAQLALRAVREGRSLDWQDRNLPQDRNPDRKYRRPISVGETVRLAMEGHKAMPEGTQERRPHLHEQVREFHGDFARVSQSPAFPKLVPVAAQIMHEVEAEKRDGIPRLRPGERELLQENTVGGYCRPSHVGGLAAARLGLKLADVVKPNPKLDPEVKTKTELRSTIRGAMAESRQRAAEIEQFSGGFRGRRG